MSYHDYGWRPYVSVATRRRRAAQTVAKLQRSGRVISPVTIEGRKIARTFWGESWCRNLEAYSDYVNRLPRGRAYVRNGSVIEVVDLGRVLLTDRRQGGASASHVCRDNTDGVVRCANQGCTLCLADADPVVTGWPLS